MMQLNLARKWRPKNINEIVGQELSVRILKNSLYRRQFAPVYLLSGQRGCGKTTTGRLFAAAINCAQLEKFIEAPQQTVLPCLQCASCCAFVAGQHPDIIEIDAASYTGVDNVRQIIDTSSLLPIIGTKKIYLIDEAHMLSKAAFNAFLKILEEPSPHLLFMLATTEAHKIIDTVRSRCFQLFFDPLPTELLMQHLGRICASESIEYDNFALSLIAYEAEGSVRDALNNIERIYLAQGRVTQEGVGRLLGYGKSLILFTLFEHIIQRNSDQVIAIYVQEIAPLWTPEIAWKRIAEFVRALVWAHHGQACGLYKDQFIQLQKLAAQGQIEQLLSYMELMYEYESVFIKTGAKGGLLELLLIKMTGNKGTISAKIYEKQPIIVPKQDSSLGKIDSDNHLQQAGERIKIVTPEHDDIRWKNFLKKSETVLDPIIFSVFKQARIEYNASAARIIVSKDLMFFREMIEAAQKVWKSLFEEIYTDKIVVSIQFDDEKKVTTSGSISGGELKERSIAKAVSPQIQTLMRIFPGTITEMKEENA